MNGNRGLEGGTPQMGFFRGRKTSDEEVPQQAAGFFTRSPIVRKVKQCYNHHAKDGEEPRPQAGASSREKAPYGKAMGPCRKQQPTAYNRTFPGFFHTNQGMDP